MAKHTRERGFTLLEIIVALSILAISLIVLLQSQATSLQHAARSRDVAVATLLLRSKMVDVSQRLFHEGFVNNDQLGDGDFKKEGYPDIKWKSRVSEVELDLTNLLGMCQGLANKKSSGTKSKKDSHEGEANDCDSMLQLVGGGMGGLLTELGRSMRAVEIEIAWPVGRYEERMSLRALMTRDDFQTMQEGDAARNAQKLESDAAMLGIGNSALPTTQSVPSP